jgi:Flp pilus assembly protein TadD
MDPIGIALRAGLLFLVAPVLTMAGQSLQQASSTDVCRVAIEKTEQLIGERSFPEAQQTLKGTAPNCPNVPEMFNTLGMAYDSLGKLDEARAAFEEATRLKPNSASFHNNLATSFMR